MSRVATAAGASALLRSLLFTTILFVSVPLYCVPVLLCAGFSYRARFAIVRNWARLVMTLLELLCGLRYTVEGREHLPAQPCVVLLKHQSAWETFALIPLFRDPVFLMKRELFWIPFHGWFSHKFEMIPVDRDKGPAALRRMLREAKKRVADGREIIIFPEGTRRPPGAQPDYKTGVVLLYEALGIPCVPVALNSGLFWPRRSLERRAGTIVVEFLDPIPPGLPKDEFLKRLIASIETASMRLFEEAEAEGTTTARQEVRASAAGAVSAATDGADRGGDTTGAGGAAGSRPLRLRIR